MKGYSVSLMSHAECTHETTRVARQKCRRDRERLGIDTSALVDKPRKIQDPYERFLTKVEIDENTGCWLWLDSLNEQGYGKFGTGGSKKALAHRWSLEQKLGRKLGPDEVARHTCDVPACVSPDHLLPGSKADNARDMVQRNRQRSGVSRQQHRGLTPYERFMKYVDSETTPDGCHRWTGYITPLGYGQFGARGADGKYRNYKSHRWLMGHLRGKELAPDEVVMHWVCDNTACVRREHLRVGTHAENMADMVSKKRHNNASKTHCKNGHEFTPENTRVRKEGWRQCKTCQAERREAKERVSEP